MLILNEASRLLNEASRLMMIKTKAQVEVPGVIGGGKQGGGRVHIFLAWLKKALDSFQSPPK